MNQKKKNKKEQIIWFSQPNLMDKSWEFPGLVLMRGEIIIKYCE
jgi:hypothetical protein